MLRRREVCRHFALRGIFTHYPIIQTHTHLRGLTAIENYSQLCFGAVTEKGTVMECDWNARGDLAETERLKDWLESQACVMSFWMDRLVETAVLFQWPLHRGQCAS